jgi:hypothetical protein
MKSATIYAWVNTLFILSIIIAIPIISVGAYVGDTAMWMGGAIMFNLMFAIFALCEAIKSVKPNQSLCYMITAVAGKFIGITIIMASITISIYMIVSSANETDSQKWKLGIIILSISWIIGLVIYSTFFELSMMCYKEPNVIIV